GQHRGRRGLSAALADAVSRGRTLRGAAPRALRSGGLARPRTVTGGLTCNGRRPRVAPVPIQRPDRVRSHRVTRRTLIMSVIAAHRAVSPPPNTGTRSATGVKTARVASIAQAR